jgi:hypothetical protein
MMAYDSACVDMHPDDIYTRFNVYERYESFGSDSLSTSTLAQILRLWEIAVEL